MRNAREPCGGRSDVCCLSQLQHDSARAPPVCHCLQNAASPLLLKYDGGVETKPPLGAPPLPARGLCAYLEFAVLPGHAFVTGSSFRGAALVNELFLNNTGRIFKCRV